MTSTDETPPAAAPENTPSRRQLGRWPVIAAAAVVVAGIAVAVAVAGDDGPDATSTADNAQLVAVQQACQDWINDQGAPSGSDATWCSNMTDWMQGRMRGGQMMGSAMWGNPERMSDTCAQWMASGPAGATGAAGVADPEAWCDDMVSWMDQHTDDWGGWMHN